MDLSDLDKKCFIDKHVYNCPFCKRNHVKYSLIRHFSFDWESDKECFCYITRCSSCGKDAIHWSYENISSQRNTSTYDHDFDVEDIDEKIFFSHPTSYFTLNNLIPSKIRELIYEAENCRQANLLTGSSACLRKAIYQLISIEKTIIKNEQSGYANYQESIKNLKEKYPTVTPEYFDILSGIQEISSDLVHEDSWEGWGSKTISMITELLKGILEEIYVLPDKRTKKLQSIQELRKRISNKNTTTS